MILIIIWYNLLLLIFFIIIYCAYLTTRKENQLKKKQAMVAVTGKILQIVYAVVTRNEQYEAARVFTQNRMKQLKAA